MRSRMRGVYIFDSKDVFPVARMVFEGLSAPVPANQVKIVKAMYTEHGIETLPILITSHFRREALDVERMLNIKRFLRSDSLHRAALSPRRIDMPETWRSRCPKPYPKTAFPRCSRSLPEIQ